MQLRIFTEPQQGASYQTLLDAALVAEEGGFDAFFRSDHYLRMGQGDPLPGPTDAWITLAGLARDTSTIRLGTLVTSATFRLPGPLAIAVAQVDDMSQGRIELGLGAGWFQEEHEAYGIPFPSLGERFERLAEQLEIITGLWDSKDHDSYGFSGDHYRLSGSPGLPKPYQRPHPPIIVGGRGSKKTPALVARFADEFNTPFLAMKDAEEAFGRVRRACEEAQRDPNSLVYSSALVACVGADQKELERRAAAIGRDLDSLRKEGICGTPEQVKEKIAEWSQAGAERLYLQILDLDDLDHIRLIAGEVLPSI